jgi:hypothetical protein
MVPTQARNHRGIHWHAACNYIARHEIARAKEAGVRIYLHIVGFACCLMSALALSGCPSGCPSTASTPLYGPWADQESKHDELAEDAHLDDVAIAVDVLADPIVAEAVDGDEAHEQV